MSSLAQEHGFEPLAGEPPDAAPVARIGRFEIVEEIGKGSMGVVYLARDPMIGRWVAVKKLTGIKGKALDPDTVRRLLINEARNVGALEHPGIVTVFDIIEDPDGRVEALAMEFVRGKSLHQRLDDPEPISLKYVSEILAAVAVALDYAHESGCIHRDVKPANILLGDDGVIKIADFGIATLRGEDLATELRNLGTPNYLAPERVMGQPGDALADIYSLGVILYELLTRHRPFEATSIAELVRKIVQDEPTPPRQFAPALMPGLEAILVRAVAREPQDRYQTAVAMAAAVHEIVEAQEVLNDTVPAPLSLLPKRAEVLTAAEPLESRPSAVAAVDPVVRVPGSVAPPRTRPASPSSSRLARNTEPSAISAGDLPDGTPEDLAGLPLEAEMEEVEWQSAGTAVPPRVVREGPPAAVTVAHAGLAKTRAVVLAVWRGTTHTLGALGTWSRAWAERAAAAIRARPAVAAAATFVVALPLLLLVLGSGGEVSRIARSGGDTLALVRRQVVGLLVESRASFRSGDTAAAEASLHQADLLFPVSSEGGRSGMLLAAERELDRLDRIDQLAEQAHLEIARAGFVDAQNSIRKLVELEAPEGTLNLLESSLLQARQRIRRSRPVRRSEPPAVAATPVPTPRVERAASVIKAAPPTGPGWLRIEFTSALPRGVLTIFSDDKQVLNRRYRFVEKRNFLVRKGVGGSFKERIELPEGVRNLRIYLTQFREPAQYRPITVEIPPGGSTTLRLRVQPDGRFVVDAG